MWSCWQLLENCLAGPRIGVNRHVCLGYVWEVEGCRFQEPLPGVFRP